MTVADALDVHQLLEPLLMDNLMQPNCKPYLYSFKRKQLNGRRWRKAEISAIGKRCLEEFSRNNMRCLS